MISKENNNGQPKAAQRRRIAGVPAGVVEIQPEFLLGARVGSRGSALRNLGVTGLDSGAINPSPTQLNITNRQEITQKLRGLSRSVGGGAGRTALLLPDAIVRVAVLTFDTLPAKEQEREALLRWRMKDALGFPAEQATLSYQIMLSQPKAVEVLVIAIKTEVLRQYVEAIESIRAEAVLVLPVTMALLPLLPEEVEGGQLLSHIHSGCVTTVVATGRRLRFWRSRRMEHPGADSVIREALSESARAAASVRDRMKIEIQQAWYCARPDPGEHVAADLSRAVGCPAGPVPLGRESGAALGTKEKPFFEAFGAPIAGLLMNAGGMR